MRHAAVAVWLLLPLACSGGGGGSAPSSTGNQDELDVDLSLSDTDQDGLPNALEAALKSDFRDSHSPYPYGHLDTNSPEGPSGDGIVDGLELYLLDHGAAPPISALSDSDGDGIPDYFEVRYGASAFAASDPIAHGARDRNEDTGPAGDGISDGLEGILHAHGAGQVTRFTDTDADGAPDYVEVFFATNPFKAASKPSLAADQDGDGLPTYLEIALGSRPFDQDDPFADGDADTDLDGIEDGLEYYLTQLDGAPENSVTFATDQDGDGIADVHEVRYAQSAAGLANDPFDQGALDSDGDGLPDGLERYVAHRTGHDGEDITRASDLDGDGLPAVLEVRLEGGLPEDANAPVANGASDRDGDQVTDAVESYLASLEGMPPIITPVNATTDSDGDGRPDAAEVANGFDPQAIDLERFAERVLPNVIVFDHNGERTNNHGVRYVAIRVLSVQYPQERAWVNLHEVRFRDTTGALIPSSAMSIVAATPHECGHVVHESERERSVTGHPPESLFDGVLDQSDPDPTHWTAANSKQAVGMYTARDEPPFAFVVIDLGAAHDLGDMLIWNGLQAAGRSADVITVELFQSLEFALGGGPGGIVAADGKSDLTAWFRADQGPSPLVDQAPVDVWRDLSGYARDAVPQTSRPVYHATTPANGMPSVYFDKNDVIFPRPVTLDFSLFVVAGSKQSKNGNWWETEGSFMGIEIAGCPGDMGMGFLDSKFFWAACGILNTTEKVNDGKAHILTATRETAKHELKLWVNGELAKTGDSESQTLDGSPTWGLGQVITGGRLIGDMWEVAAYARMLAQTERELLDNYFNAKFGMTILHDAYHFDLTHGLEVSGIGQVSATDRVTQAHGRDLVEILAPSALSNGDRLLWGTDRVDPFSTSFDVPLSLPRRLAQTWAFEEQDGGAGDGVGLVSVRFHLDHVVARPEQLGYQLLIDTDTTFADAQRVTTFAIDAVQNTVTFPDVRLGTSGYFALAIGDQ